MKMKPEKENEKQKRSKETEYTTMEHKERGHKNNQLR